MKTPISILLVLLALLCGGGCFTMMSQQPEVVHKQTFYMKPEAAWYDAKSGAVAVSGAVNGWSEKYYLIIPAEIAQGLVSGDKTLFTRDVSKLPDSVSKKLTLVKGDVPPGYVRMEYKYANPPGGGLDYMQAAETVSKVDGGALAGRIVSLPFAVVLDAITLPIQLLVLPGLKSGS